MVEVPRLRLARRNTRYVIVTDKNSPMYSVNEGRDTQPFPKTKIEMELEQMKRILEFDIPCQGDEQVDRYNEIFKDSPGFVPMKTIEQRMNELLDKVFDTIEEVGDEGGWFIGDGIKVKVDIEYDPENK